MTAGRAFVRSLNILLKFARLYGYDHARTNRTARRRLARTAHRDSCWNRCRTCCSARPAASSYSTAYRSKARLRKNNSRSCFPPRVSPASSSFPSITEEELGRFARAFPTGKAKPAELAEQLKAALTGAQGIRINEICFVATDSRFRDANVAAQLAAATLGDDQDQFKQWLNDPQKLLEMIAAAQGAKSGSGSGGRRAREWRERRRAGH